MAGHTLSIPYKLKPLMLYFSLYTIEKKKYKREKGENREKKREIEEKILRRKPQEAGHLFFSI